jgi:hypothetical protein
VGDADNFRLYHTPGFGWRWPLKFRHIPSGYRRGALCLDLDRCALGYPTHLISKTSSRNLLTILTTRTTNAGLKDLTIHIRVAGMDAPEVSLRSLPVSLVSCLAFR